MPVGEQVRGLVREDVPVDSDAILALEREIGLFLRRSKAVSSSIGQEIHPDIETSAYVLLVTIRRNPGIRASDLAALIQVGRGTMSRQLAHLAEMGLLARDPDPRDSRGQLLRLTDEGERRVADALQARRGFLHAALADWSEEEILTLAVHLDRLNTAIAEQRRLGEGPRPVD